jgi:peptidoglycan-N-acetylglucosamine deacetylase
MDRFFVKTGKLLHRFFPQYEWKIQTKEPVIYLTFDDGPTPEITHWVLDTLKQFDAKATFFCIGQNLQLYPDITHKVLEEGHAIGNHTFRHENGWKTSTEIYVESAEQTQSEIGKNFVYKSRIFRPPYGKIRKEQAQQLIAKGYKIIMWDILSRDYNPSVTPEICISTVVKNASSGSIIVFHDSKKAFPVLEKALPEILVSLKNKGYRFKSLN